MPPISRAQNVNTHALFIMPLTEDEVSSVLKRIKNCTAGADKVTSHQLRETSLEDLTTHLNEIIRSHEVPNTWRRGILVAIPKNNKSQDPAQTRGLALQSAHRKLFTTCLEARILEYLGLHAHLPPLQNGFRPGRRTADNLFILRTLHEQALEVEQALIIAQIDIKKAFDSVDRAKLFTKLYGKGIAGPLIERDPTNGIHRTRDYNPSEQEILGYDKEWYRSTPRRPTLPITLYTLRLRSRHSSRDRPEIRRERNSLGSPCRRFYHNPFHTRRTTTKTHNNDQTLRYTQPTCQPSKMFNLYHRSMDTNPIPPAHHHRRYPNSKEDNSDHKWISS